MQKEFRVINLTEATNTEEDENVIKSEFYFPSGVYTIHKPEYLKNAKMVLNRQLKNKKEVNEIYPVSYTSHIFDESMGDLLNFIAQTGWNILESQGYDMQRIQTNVTDFWGQKLLKHGQQAEHIHGYGAQLVGFYFIEVPENSTRPYIVDPRPAKVQINLPEIDSRNATYGSNKINFDVKPGDLMFTNAWMPHGFEPNASDKPFKFIHFIINATSSIQPSGEFSDLPEVVG